MDGLNIIIVIPAYKEEATIGRVIRGLEGVATSVVVVDDCSPDNTGNEARKYSAEVLINAKNLGYSRSIEVGLKYAAAKYNDGFIITMDADGQHTLEALKSVISKAVMERLDLVVGHRGSFARISEGMLAVVFSWLRGVGDPLSGLKCYRTSMLKKCVLNERFDTIGTSAMIELLSMGASYGEAPIVVRDRLDSPRLGGRITANIKIFQSSLKILWFLLGSKVK